MELAGGAVEEVFPEGLALELEAVAGGCAGSGHAGQFVLGWSCQAKPVTGRPSKLSLQYEYMICGEGIRVRILTLSQVVDTVAKKLLNSKCCSWVADGLCTSVYSSYGLCDGV